MIKCFVDDSGSGNLNDPALVLAGWSGKVETWDRFAKHWKRRLDEIKAIDYYKHSEAISRTGCFKNFTIHQATQKTIDMSRVVSEYHIYSFVVTVPHSLYQSAVVDKVIRHKRQKVNRRIANRFYAAFGMFTSFVLNTHLQQEVHDTIDFVVDSGDKTDKQLHDAILVWGKMKQSIKQDPTNPWNELAGEVIPGNDKKVMPLQAADLLAGQIRRAAIHNSQPAVLQLWETHGKSIFRYDVGEADMNNFVGRMNLVGATDRLERIVRERRQI